MSLWVELVGQEPVVETLREVAVTPAAMTHAWLFTGPPGSGRSNAAVAFAAALQCESGGCGECQSCQQAQAGSHPDITIIRTDGLSIGVDLIRDYVRRAALSPVGGRWQVMIVEDADRLTDQAANALLKSLEEPSPHTVWMLCAPAIEDVLITVRSRCRSVRLSTPSTDSITELLHSRDGIDRELARLMAQASQGHIGRALALARDAEARDRRRSILALPTGLRNPGDCLAAAAAIDDEAKTRAAEFCDAADERELDALRQAWGVGERGKQPAGYAGARAAMTKDQEKRRKRMARDSVDGVLLDLLSYCRDVMALQLGGGSIPPVNADVAELIAESARAWTTAGTLKRLDAIVGCREALEANAAPLLALEAMMVSLWEG